MGQLLSPGIEDYIEVHSSDQSAVLYELERYTRLHHLMPQMLSGPVQGAFLSMFCQAINARKILEVGTFTGYTAICMASVMPQGSRIISIDINEETTCTAREFVNKAGLNHIIDLKTGDALEIIAQMDEKEFDLVFIDADKENYSNYYDLIFDKVRANGWILADNVLWSGKVIEPDPDYQTLAIQLFNDKVKADKRVNNVILSIRDGIMMVQKIN